MEQEYPAQESNPGQQMYAPNAGHSGNILTLTDPENILERLEKHLRGESENSDGTWCSSHTPLMNEEGINKIMSIMRSIVNRITFMSNLDEDHIERHMMFLGNTLIETLLQNKKQFGIQNDPDRDSIMLTCGSLAFMSLRRGFKEGDKRFFKGSTMEVAYTNPVQGGGVPGGAQQGSKINPMNWWK